MHPSLGSEERSRLESAAGARNNQAAIGGSRVSRRPGCNPVIGEPRDESRRPTEWPNPPNQLGQVCAAVRIRYPRFAREQAGRVGCAPMIANRLATTYPHAFSLLRLPHLETGLLQHRLSD